MNIDAAIAQIEDQNIRALIAHLYNENIELREENRSLKRQLFAQKSERLRPADPVHPKGSLFDEAEALIEKAEQKDGQGVPASGGTKGSEAKKRQPREGGPISPKLERRRVEIDLPEEQKICGCGCKMEKIGEEITEKLSREPATFFVNQIAHFKYACKGCQCNVVQAKAEPSPVPGSSLDTSVIAWILSAKYAQGLPLYRLESELESFGAEVTRLTMSRTVIRASEALNGVYEYLRNRVMSSSVVCADETPVQVLKGKSRADSKHYMWVACSGPFDHPSVIFMHDPTRSSEAAKKLLSGFTGSFLVADGYAGYNGFLAQNEQVQHAGCWAHARRKFEDAMQSGSTDPCARLFLEKIKDLFLLERELKQLSSEDRLRQRQSQAPPILEEIRELLDKMLVGTLPSGKLGRALSYLENQWTSLQTFLDHGDVPLSNNHCENMIRPFVMGRKAWLFSASEAGAKASSIIYSLVVTARKHDLNTEHYLRNVLDSVAEASQAGKTPDYEELMPWSYKARILGQKH